MIAIWTHIIRGRASVVIARVGSPVLFQEVATPTKFKQPPELPTKLKHLLTQHKLYSVRRTVSPFFISHTYNMQIAP